jgi:hypothetical protein
MSVADDLFLSSRAYEGSVITTIEFDSKSVRSLALTTPRVSQEFCLAKLQFESNGVAEMEWEKIFGPSKGGMGGILRTTEVSTVFDDSVAPECGVVECCGPEQRSEESV